MIQQKAIIHQHRVTTSNIVLEKLIRKKKRSCLVRQQHDHLVQNQTLNMN